MLITTRQGNLIELNPGQEEALNEMTTWMRSGLNTLFCLEGPAGSGKTTIVNEFLNRFPDLKVCVSAPIHRAKFVIKRATGREDFTIQKLVGLKPNFNIDNLDLNKMQFERDPFNAKIKEYALCVIDESSMINSDLFEFLAEISEEYRVKILFMGDRAQTPPVKQDKATVFVDKRVLKYNLIKVERQVGESPILKVCDYVRNIKTGNPKFGTEIVDDINEVGSVNVYHGANENQFGAELIKALKNNLYNVKMLCYTNDTVVASNQQIRKALKPNAKEIIEVGDILISYTNQSDCIIVQGHNSSDYEVMNVRIENVISSTGKKFKAFITILKEIDTGLQGEVNILHPDDYDYFLKETTRLLLLAEKATYGSKKFWDAYTSFKQSFMVMKDLHRSERPPKSRNSYIPKDFDYAYVITSHKCIGGSIPEVFVNWPDIASNYKYQERLSLFYVACSRAIKKLHILY